MDLGAEAWVDFKESTDLIKDVVAAADGLGPEAAIIAAGNVRSFSVPVHKTSLVSILISFLDRPRLSTKP